MLSNEILETIMGLVTILGASAGLVVTGVVLVALLLRGVDLAQSQSGRDTTAT